MGSDDLLVVKPHDGNVARDGESHLTQGIVGAHGSAVVKAEDGRGWLRQPHQHIDPGIAALGNAALDT